MKFNKITKILAIAASIYCLGAYAKIEIPESTLNKDVPEVYVVKKGDTLWDISEMFFKNPWKWTYIWEKNQEIENPHLIYPDDKIYLVNSKDGTKELKIERARKPEEKVLIVTPNKQYYDLYKAIDVVNFEKIEKISRKIIISQMKEIEKFSYILESEEDHLMLNKNDEVYVTGTATKALYDEVDAVYRLDSPIYLNDEYKGHKLIKIGELKLISTNSDEEISKYKIESQNQRIKKGDFVLREESLRNKILKISPPKYTVNTSVMQIVGGVNYGGTWDTIVIDGGEDIGLEEGNILSLNKKGKSIVNPKGDKNISLPMIEYGSVLIFDVQKEVSLGLVYENKNSIRIGDIASNPKEVK